MVEMKKLRYIREYLVDTGKRQSSPRSFLILPSSAIERGTYEYLGT